LRMVPLEKKKERGRNPRLKLLFLQKGGQRKRQASAVPTKGSKNLLLEKGGTSPPVESELQDLPHEKENSDTTRGIDRTGKRKEGEGEKKKTVIFAYRNKLPCQVRAKWETRSEQKEVEARGGGKRKEVLVMR